MSRLFAGVSTDHLDNSAPPLTATAPNGFTYSAWLRDINLSSQSAVVTIGNSGVANQRWSLQITAANQVGAQAFDTTSNSNNTVAVIADANWHLCVVTFASDDTTKRASLDGGSITSGGALRSPVMTTPVVRIGSVPNGSNAFSGLVAHVAMWNIVLNATDIASLFINPPNYVRPESLQEYWPLNNNQSPEPSFGLIGTSLTVTGTSFNADDPFGYPVQLMGQGFM